jgi:ankyrin repeat protein
MDVDAQNKNGDSALNWAAWNDHKEIVQALVKAGASVNAKNKDGDSALNWATWNGNKEIVSILKEPVTKKPVTLEEIDSLKARAKEHLQQKKETHGTNSMAATLEKIFEDRDEGTLTREQSAKDIKTAYQATPLRTVKAFMALQVSNPTSVRILAKRL